MTTLFFNAQILSMTHATPSIMLGAVGVVDSRIVMVSDSQPRIEAFEAEHPNLRRIDCERKLLMPGLINAHTHLSMTLERSSGDDVELMEWLNKIVWPFEAMQSEDDIEAGARLGVAEMLLGGTTSFVDMYWSELRVAEVVDQMGIRAMLGECCLDGAPMERYHEVLPKLVERASKCDRISVVVSPHAPYTCPPVVLKRCVELANEHSLPLNIHLAETLDETKTIAEIYDMTPTEYIDSCGVLTPSTILAHSIHLSDSDIEIIKQRGATVVHNPQCNMKISSGVARIPELLAAGVNCALGTDGVCSNNDLDMWDEMRTASFLHKLTSNDPTTMPAYEVLRMATVGGAKAMGMDGELGIIAEGALADIVVLNTNKIHYRPNLDLISSVLYCGKAADVQHVMVHGKLLVEDYTLLGCDIEAICTDVEQRSRAIFAAMGREA